MILVRDSKTFYFDFDCLKDANKNLKHEIEFIIKSNESSTENKIKDKTKLLLLEYKHGSNINTGNNKTN